ncbi:MAG: MarR family winged helix-turn-helix transcriptional regulator [Pseudomonadota bacterium]
MADSTLPEIERTIGALLRVPWQVLAERVYGALAAGGYPEIRPAHGVVFRYIRAEGSRIVELAERAGMTKQSMAVLVDHLATHGYVSVEPDPSDGRAKRVRLTRSGKEVQRAALKLSRQVEAEWAALIGAQEMASLRQLLERLYDSLQDSR